MTEGVREDGCLSGGCVTTSLKLILCECSQRTVHWYEEQNYSKSNISVKASLRFSKIMFCSRVGEFRKGELYFIIHCTVWSYFISCILEWNDFCCLLQFFSSIVCEFRCRHLIYFIHKININTIYFCMRVYTIASTRSLLIISFECSQQNVRYI